MARRTSRSSIWPRCAPCRTSTCSGRPMRRDGRVLGAGAGGRRTPSILALTRQAVPALRDGGRGEPVGQGRLRLGRGQRRQARVTLLATGSEVGVAMEARELLGQGGDRGGGRVDAVLGTVCCTAVLPIAPRCWVRRRALPSRRRSRRAGSGGWARAAASSA